MSMVVKALSGGASVVFGLAVAFAGTMTSARAADAVPVQNDCGCTAAVGTTGVVQSVHGKVFVSQATGSVPAKPNMSLAAGDSVTVGPKSASTVRFGKNCTLNLAANTVFEARNTGDRLCLAVNEQAEAVASHNSWLAPALIAGGIGIGVIAIAASDDDKSVSR